jgi:hypothetical protein
MKIGEINNCEKCGASYGEYDDNPQSDLTERWCEVPVSDRTIKESKGLCQFCNPKSRFYNKV